MHKMTPDDPAVETLVEIAKHRVVEQMNKVHERGIEGTLFLEGYKEAVSNLLWDSCPEAWEKYARHMQRIEKKYAG